MSTSRAISRVFISHSSEDKELVRDIARRLREQGLEPFDPSAGIPGGQNWKAVLRKALREADAVLFLVTPAALRSSWTMTELGMAEGFDRDIIPVMAGVKPRDLPAPLQSYQ